MPTIVDGSYSRQSVDISIVATANGGSTESARSLAIQGWTKLGYTIGMDPGIGYGQGPAPKTRTQGKLKLGMQLSLLVADYNDMIAYLADEGADNGFGFMLVTFDLTATLYEPEQGVSIWNGVSCRISNVKGGPGDNDDPLEIDLDLSVMNILQNGLSPTGGLSPAKV